MQGLNYQQRRGEIEHYFDRTAAQAWERLTSNEPVGKIRATVRAGRDQMRGLLLNWLPLDLRGQRVLDAGCGTGALAVQAALRGASVLAIDLSPTMVGIAQQRMPQELLAQIAQAQGSVEFRSGDMLDPALGKFDYMVGMDSLIHYAQADVLNAVQQLAPRVGRAMYFTFAPKTPALSLMHQVGKLFPRADRAPSIVPVGYRHLARALTRAESLNDWVLARSERVASGFYTSHAIGLIRSKELERISRKLPG
jgi:magnesium-protoporphyrin O-methyltransferase